MYEEYKVNRDTLYM